MNRDKGVYRRVKTSRAKPFYNLYSDLTVRGAARENIHLMKHSTHTDFSPALDNLSPAPALYTGKRRGRVRGTSRSTVPSASLLFRSGLQLRLPPLSLFCSLALAPVWVRQINLRRELGKRKLFSPDRETERQPRTRGEMGILIS